MEITHPQKVLFPDDGITKKEFVDYFRQIAEVMLPHIKGRPVVMHRFSDGIQGESFYQQAISAQAPAWVKRVTVKKQGGTVTHIICDDAATLIYVANQNCITLHTWLSRKDQLNKPDQLIFDLDPAGNDFEPVRRGAKAVKSWLDEIGLASYLKTSGSHGLHVAVPLIVSESFEAVRELAQDLAQILTLQEPDKYTTEQRKEKRKNRLFIDTLRNAYAHTAVAPYAVRARRGAPIAAPLFWEELDQSQLTSERYNIRNIFKRLEQVGDPWKGMEHQAQSLNQPRRNLAEVLKKLGFRRASGAKKPSNR